VAVIIADTDVLIDALAGRDAGQRIADGMRSGALATTSVTAFELGSGARNDIARERIRVLLEGLHVLPFDLEAARRATGVRLALEEQGRPIGMADYLIAGVCLASGAALLTRNRAHFERVPGLTLA
jgi:predicted nucleic acid-binding protein